MSISKILNHFTLPPPPPPPPTLLHMNADSEKISKIVRNIIGPLAESSLIEKIRTKNFSLSVDESTNYNKNRMLFLVRFVDSETLNLTTALPKLITFDATRLNANWLLAQFKKYMTDNQIIFFKYFVFALWWCIGHDQKIQFIFPVSFERKWINRINRMYLSQTYSRW